MYNTIDTHLLHIFWKQTIDKNSYVIVYNFKNAKRETLFLTFKSLTLFSMGGGALYAAVIFRPLLKKF